jgi:hypothetical protein
LKKISSTSQNAKERYMIEIEQHCTNKNTQAFNITVQTFELPIKKKEKKHLTIIAWA